MCHSHDKLTRQTKSAPAPSRAIAAEEPKKRKPPNPRGGDSRPSSRAIASEESKKRKPPTPRGGDTLLSIKKRKTGGGGGGGSGNQCIADGCTNLAQDDDASQLSSGNVHKKKRKLSL